MKYGEPPRLKPEQIKKIKDIVKELERGVPTIPHEDVAKRLREKYGKR